MCTGTALSLPIINISDITAIPADEDAPLLSYVWTIRRLLAADPTRFPTHDEHENVNRAVEVLRYFLRVANGSRGTGANRRDDKATQPEFWPREGIVSSNRVESTETKPAKPASFVITDIGPIRAMDDETTGPVESIQKDLSECSTETDFPDLDLAMLEKLIDSLTPGAEDIDFTSTATRNDSNLVSRAEGHSLDADLAEQQVDTGVMEHLNSAGATPPTYQEACDILGIDRNLPLMGPLELQPWQVNAVAWMLQQELTSAKGGILADDCGLRKTVACLSLVVKATQVATTFRPTLILAPSHVLMGWVDEIHRSFTDLLNLHFYYSSKGAGGITDMKIKRYIVSTAELQAVLSKLDPTDPSTGQIVVLSSYNTWKQRTAARYSSREPDHDDSDRDDRDDDDEDAGPVGGHIQNTHWERVILDEGHAVKNPRTRVHRCVASLRAGSRWIVTATK
jgi:hypothetical protein